MHARRSSSYVTRRSSLLSPLLAGLFVSACTTGHGSPLPPNGQTPPVVGQSDFESATPAGFSGSGQSDFAGGGSLASGAPTPTENAGAPSAAPAPTRTVAETDLYRLDGNRLYYLNSYRGLMVFDLTNVDQPKFLGRSPIVGSPVQMYVNNGVAVVVVADWYGTLSGQPFYGSIVRGLDATDPSNIKVLGEAPLGGQVQDLRVVGNVLYAVSEDDGYWGYGWGNGGVVYANGNTTSSVIVSSVDFGNNQITQVDSKTYPGYSGVFNVTPNSILFANPVTAPDGTQTGGTELRYLDITDPTGIIKERGTITVAGQIQGFGTDNGRWNLDFADGVTAHVVGCNDSGCSNYVLSIADFSNPDAPVLDAQLPIASNGWGSAAARFDTNRLYLTPNGTYTSDGTVQESTPVEVFDLSNPQSPVLAGQVAIPGIVWMMVPQGNQLFALGQDSNANASLVSLKYLDVTNAATPTLIGASDFGDGWAWTPAAETFKAFTNDPTQGLVVLPFSGWSNTSQQYNNGVQLIEYTPTTITTAGAGKTRGWVERGIFANGRIVSLSDLALSVIDYTNPLIPTVTAQLTLARNVIASKPAGSTLAEISGTDWWGNDQSTSDVRVLPITDPAEIADESSAPDVSIPGVNAQVFTNGSFIYTVTAVQVPIPCPVYQGQPTGTGCTGWQERVEVVDTSNGTAKARGSIALPVDPGYSWYWGFYGCFYYDWYDGSEIVQVGNDALAFRRWHPSYNTEYFEASDSLFVVDLSNPDKPTMGSTVITDDVNGWWGNMQVVGNTLYTTHYEWPAWPYYQWEPVRYYLDAIDLSNRAYPTVAARINVPGMLVGGSATDPSVLYTIDYRFEPDPQNPGNFVTVNDFDVLQLDNDNLAHLQSTTRLDGWVGNVLVRGTTAYTTTQLYDYTGTGPSMELHQLDLTDPTKPVDFKATGPNGWGWLLDIQGDRALITSGWYDQGLDIYRISPSSPPTYDQFVRTQGWGVSSVSRQGNQLFLSSGDWGVQAVTLAP